MARVLRSNGESQARAFTKAEVRPSPPEPAVDPARVQIVDPRDTSTVRTGAPFTGAGPRDAEQSVWPTPDPPAVDLPDQLPADKAQRVILDPALVARWREEAKRKESA
jgi:hypothetical protein